MEPSNPHYHHHRPYDFPPPPPPPHFYLPPPEPYFSPEHSHINTLFIAGLPDDVKPREIHNLFRSRPGFESSQLEYTGRGNQAVAFATFYDHRSAVATMNELHGTIFDLDTGVTLHIELARSNSRRKRPRGGGAYHVIDKRVKISNRGRETCGNDGDDGWDEPLDSDNDYSSEKGALHGIKSGEMTDADNSQVAEQLEKLPEDVSRCSTLFIGNLGPNCKEEELKQVLSIYSGFQTLKIRGRVGILVAFADFKDVTCSTEALNGLQGKLLDSSNGIGLHVEYARSKMRKG